jgi:hypothetical protein
MKPQKDLDKLLKTFDIFIKKNNLKKDDFVIFGSSVLAINGIRSPNDLDICTPAHIFKELKKHALGKCSKYCAQIDIGKLSFIHELAVPKTFNKNTTQLYKGFKFITNNNWIQMCKKDVEGKDSCKMKINKQEILESYYGIIQESKKIDREKKAEKKRSVPCNGIKEKKGFSCFEELKRGNPTGNFYISTHRARSKNYKSFADIPTSVINFIDSTG